MIPTLEQGLKIVDKKLELLFQGRLIKAVAVVVKDDTVRNFVDEGFGGTKWIPKQKPNGKKILRDTGKLLEDVKKSVSNGKLTGPLEYTINIITPYSGYHQEGTDKMPKRQMIGMTEDLSNKINDKISKLMAKAFTLNWLASNNSDK